MWNEWEPPSYWLQPSVMNTFHKQIDYAVVGLLKSFPSPSSMHQTACREICVRFTHRAEGQSPCERPSAASDAHWRTADRGRWRERHLDRLMEINGYCSEGATFCFLKVRNGFMQWQEWFCASIAVNHDTWCAQRKKKSTRVGEMEGPVGEEAQRQAWRR